MGWTRLLRRIFDIDVKHWPNCGGSVKIIAAIEDPPVIVKILTHLGLLTRAPPCTSASSRLMPRNPTAKTAYKTQADVEARSDSERARRKDWRASRQKNLTSLPVLRIAPAHRKRRLKILSTALTVPSIGKSHGLTLKIPNPELRFAIPHIPPVSVARFVL